MKKSAQLIYACAALLLLPALLINLGLLTFIDDEAIRSLVALEMKLSGNYITPTLHGEYYYNKPPLFNWVLLIFFNLSGRIDEFIARLPTVVALLAYGGTIYYYVRKHMGKEEAILATFLFITCGRVWFYDSLLALIDITFSWCMFVLFMATYHLFEKQKYLQLFLVTYLLTAIGFLFKGLPAIVFQGFTLLAYFSYRRQFWKLFSWQHIIGGLLFVFVVGSYYLLYHQYNDLGVVSKTLFTESSKRTVVNYGLARTVLHIISFPFEMIYHFLPWSVLVIYFFHRKIRHLLLQDKFMVFCLLTFLANIIIYWTSPEVYPRYLLMLVPLLFIVFVYLHRFHAENKTWQFRFLQILFGVVITLIAVAGFLPLFLTRTQDTAYLEVKTFAVAVPLIFIAWFYFKRPDLRMALLVLFLVVFRIGFDWFVLPDRNANDFGDLCRTTSKEVGIKYQDQPLFVYEDSLMQTTNSFYLTNARGAIIPENKDPEVNDLLIVPSTPAGLIGEKVDEIKVRHGKLTFDVVKVLSTKK